MGVYRRKNKHGEPYGPWIVQFPCAINPQTGKQKYTSVKAGHGKRLADAIFAQKMLDWEKKKHLGLEKKKDYTFRELADWYLGMPKVKQKRSYAQDVSRMTILKEEFGNFNAREIKPAMIEAFQHNLLNRRCRRGAKPYAPATSNRFLEIIKRIYNLALREDLVEKNPCLKVSKLPENNKRDRVISYTEYQAILAGLPKYAADIVTTAYYTGMRAGEIFNLTWKKVKMEEGYIDLLATDTKTSEPRRIPLNEALRGLFNGLRKVRHLKHDHVFTYEGAPVRSIKRSFKRACGAAGIEDFRFHDLRHTFNTNMRKAGVDRSVIMKITGHKTMSMFERYNTVDESDALEAYRKLHFFLNTPAPGSEITAILLQGPQQ
jgi:integrase